MKLVFVYLGPTKEAPGATVELLPRFAVHVYPDDGYIVVAWLLWASELQWRRAK